MESINSFKGYGKVNEIEDRKFRRKSRRRLTIIGISVFLLVVVVVGLTVTFLLRNRDDHSPSSPSSLVNSIKAICNVTLYPDSCYSSLSATGANATTDPEKLFNLSLGVAADALSAAAAVPDALAKGVANNKWVSQALDICKEVLLDAVYHLNSSLSLTSSPPQASKIADLRTWLSAALADQETCREALEGTAGGFQEKMEAAMHNSTRFTSNCLAIATRVIGFIENFHVPFHRKLLLSTEDKNGIPTWVMSSHRRALLQTSVGKPRPNVTVATDGSGDFSTIREAVASVPSGNEYPYVIYVKVGKYMEKVTIPREKQNVFMVGDGMTKTVVTGSLSNGNGVQTFKTASFEVFGNGFMAMDMGFDNTAGPQNNQAVAVLVMSDKSVFYRCSFTGYQDTLYAHSNKQFYRDCNIAGTVDFIFGDAQAVFQNCNIRPRQPLSGQTNTITAQKRSDPNEPTGFSIHSCTISPYDGGVSAATFLGRPWGRCSRTVVMRSEIGGMVVPAGWLAWEPPALPPDTIFYAEYRNAGAGASTAARVNWAGYRPTLPDEVAQSYTVGTFIAGAQWIPATLVGYSLGM